MNPKIKQAAEILKARGIRGTVKGAQVEGNRVHIRIQEKPDWDISQYEINVKTSKVA